MPKADVGLLADYADLQEKWAGLGDQIRQIEAGLATAREAYSRELDRDTPGGHAITTNRQIVEQLEAKLDSLRREREEVGARLDLADAELESQGIVL